MTYAAGESITILSENESWNLLAGVALGRLVTNVDDQPEIFPVNFVVQNRTVLFRTGEGTKLISSAINKRVLFEADDHNVAEGWSVIVKGVARTLRTDDEIQAGGARPVVAVDRDVEAPLRAGDPTIDHSPPLPVRPEPDRESTFA
jgi:nitroimidazol reductase NimA-like FMN-containing flavoprotein (pyridoxamine 5'-phosphate oxidase superfamily)